MRREAIPPRGSGRASPCNTPEDVFVVCGPVAARKRGKVARPIEPSLNRTAPPGSAKTIPADPRQLHEFLAIATRLLKSIEFVSGRLDNSQRESLPVDSMARDAQALLNRAPILFEEVAATLTCMRQTLVDETVDLDIRAIRVLERQRVLEHSGRSNDAEALARSMAAVQRDETSYATLHPHDSHAKTLRVRANTAMLRVTNSPI